MAQGRLLVLDDEATVGRLLVVVAQKAGFDARLCADAQSFLEVAAEWAPTHVAVDLSMPGISGLEVLRRLAAAGCLARVIISSGAGAGETEAALGEAQALGLVTAGVLPKPFSLKALRALLTNGTRV